MGDVNEMLIKPLQEFAMDSLHLVQKVRKYSWRALVYIVCMVHKIMGRSYHLLTCGFFLDWFAVHKTGPKRWL